MSEVLFHPVANIFPLLAEAELDALADDIRTNGLREPIWLHRDGRIIDGRNRWLACRKLGIKALTRTFEGENAELVRFVVSLNLHRRHLSPSQRAIVFQRLEELGHGGNRQDANLRLGREEIAKLAGVSERSLAHAAVVNRHGTDELIAAVERGEVTVSAAAAMARPEQERTIKALNNALNHKQRAAKRAERERAVASAPPNPVLSGECHALHPGDFRELAAGMPDASVDCIITDPPYPEDCLHLLSDLGRDRSEGAEAGRSLPRHGRLFHPVQGP